MLIRRVNCKSLRAPGGRDLTLSVRLAAVVLGRHSLAAKSGASPPPSRNPVYLLLWKNMAVAGVYWGLAALVQWYFFSYPMWPAPLWLPAGVALFAAIAVGRWSWPGIFVGALLPDTFSFHEPAGWAVFFSVGNTLAPMLAGELIRDRVPWTSPFSRVSGALFVSIACLVDGAIAATIGATALCGKIFAAPRVLVDKWFDWMLSNAGAAILLTPFLCLGGLILLSCRLLASSRASF